MAQGIQPLLRARGRSDADMKGFSILNVLGVGNVQQATIYVDPLMPDDLKGARGTGYPFKTFAAAVAAAQPEDLIILRPGIHAYDGVVDIFHLTGLYIIGYGATIQSASAVNEDIKITVRSQAVTIEGIEFDGMVTATPIPSGTGCITITETDCVVKNCYIHNQNGYGIHCPIHYDNLRILDNVIQTCSAAFFAEADIMTSSDTASVWVKGNKVQHNRSFGVALTGPGPDSGHFITGIQINDNEFSGNDTGANHVPVLSLSFACQGAQIHNNRLIDESSGIVVDKCRDVSIEGNNLKGMNGTAIGWTGSIGVKVTGNIIDGRNSAGSPATTSPLVASGFFAAAGDAGPFLVAGNILTNLKTNAIAVSLSNANGVILNDNRIEGTISLIGLTSVVVNGNTFTIPQTTQAILIDASSSGSNKISIVGNRFRFTGASISRCISTVDASAAGIDDILIEGNAIAPTQQFGVGPYGHSGSNPATRVIQIGNTPENFDTTLKNGWRNEGANLAIKKCFVSQATGSDLTGQPQNRQLKYATIGAAISAALAGYDVVVEDGTFNEKLTAKDEITVRFLPPAILRCTSSSGCIVSSVDNQSFTVYHEHTPIACTQNTTTAIDWTNSGAYLSLHASIEHSGAGTLPIALRCTDGTVEVWGHVHLLSTGTALELSGSGSPTVIIHGSLSGNADVYCSGAGAMKALKGTFKAIDATIVGGNGVGVELNTASCVAIFKRCTIEALAASANAITISTVGSNKPTLRSCVLKAGGSATQTIGVGSAQTILLYGQTVANKGSDPPTNVTFSGGGTYDVNADVTGD